jgi:hypothetical protein
VDVSNAGPVFKWQVTHELGCHKARKLYLVSGPGMGVNFGVHNGDLPNLLRGVYERVLYRVVDGIARPPPSPTVGVFEDLCASFRESLRRVVRVHRPLTRQEFVDKYEGRRRMIYQRAADSLALRPLCVADSYMSTFTKCEKINFSAKPDPAPRVIQPRTPRYNVEIGRYLKTMEKRICHGVADVYGGATILKGMNCVGTASALRSMWDDFDDPVGVGADAVRFDQHVSVEALSYEHSVYCALVPLENRRRLSEMLLWQLKNVGFGRTNEGSLKYTVAGRRMSGDINTGMGNCLLMCAIWHAFMCTHRLHMRLANNGDDCVVVCERRDIGVVRDHGPGWFLKFGFVLEFEEAVDVFERISFCQTQPVCVDGEWRMVRDPRVSIDKDLCTTIDISNKRGGQKWLHAIGTCGLALTSGVPVLQEFYSCLRRHGVEGNVLGDPTYDGGFLRMAAGMVGNHTAVSDLTRVSYWRAFNVNPDLQAIMEGHYSELELNLSAGEQVNQLSPINQIN